MTKFISIKRQQLYIVAPFLLLIFCLGSLNLGRLLVAPATDGLVLTVTAVPPHTPAAIAATVGATPTPTQPPATTIRQASATPYTPPTYSDNELIQLLGPPPDSTFAPDATISFYWQWPLPLNEDQVFEVYLLAEDEETLLGTVYEPNVGDSYRLHVDMSAVKVTAVPFQWQVRLKTNLRSQPLRASEQRFLMLFSSS